MADAFNTVSAAQLRAFVEKIERLEQEKANLISAVQEVFAEAKAEGFDIKTMKQIIRLRKMKKEDLEQQEELLDLYRQALGMLPNGYLSSEKSSLSLEKAA